MKEITLHYNMVVPNVLDVIGVLVNIDDIKEAGQNILHLYIVDRTKTTVCVEVRGEDVNEKLVFHAAMFSPIGFGHVKVSKSQDGFQILTVLPATAIEVSIFKMLLFIYNNIF